MDFIVFSKLTANLLEVILISLLNCHMAILCLDDKRLLNTVILDGFIQQSEFELMIHNALILVVSSFNLFLS